MTPEQAAAEREKMIDAAIKQCLSSVEGKIVFFWLMELCAIYRDPFTLDAKSTDYALGRQSVMRMIIERISASKTTAYPELLLEAAKFEAAFEEMIDATEATD